MYRSVTNGPAHAGIYRVVSSNQEGLDHHGDPNWMDYRNDCLFFPQGNVSGVTTGLLMDPVPVSDIIGVQSFDFEHPADLSFRTAKPYQDKWSRGQDWKNYGNPLGIASFLANAPAAISSREKQVSHPAYRGTVSDLFASHYDYGFLSNHSHCGIDVKKWTVRPSPHAYGLTLGTGLNSIGHIVYQQIQSAHISNMEADFWHIHRQVVDYVIAAGEHSFVFYGQPYWNYTWRNVVDTSFKTGNHYHIGLEYEFEKSWDGDRLISRWQVSLNIDFRFTPVNGSNNPFDYNVINPSVITVTNNNSYTNTFCGGVYTPNLVLSAPTLEVGLIYDGGMYTPILQRDDSVATSRFFFFRRKGDRSDIDYRHNHLHHWVRESMPNLRPSAFHSASDALNKHIEVLQANHLENLTQLSGLLSILPNLSKLPRIVSKLTRGDPSAIVEAVDYITDAIIKFRYAQSPTAGDTIELVTTDVLGELENLLKSETYTLYGDFFWEFPEVDNFLGDGRLTLRTRSKVNLTVDLSTLLANYLTANAMGILPSLSNVWATLPFSFVVDWFTNMDDRLKSVDNQLLWLCLRTNWCVHSYKVSYYPSPELLATYGLESPDASDPFHVTSYFRELSLIMPLLRDSKYDFLAPNHGPDPVIVGALAWQKLRS